MRTVARRPSFPDNLDMTAVRCDDGAHVGLAARAFCFDDWYRNMDRNWETTASLANARIEVPSLMVTAELDPVLRPEMAEPMRALVPDLEVTMIPGCGHWTQQEKPAELNAVMIDWLRRRHGGRAA